MSRILRMSDRVKVTIGKVIFTISPLSVNQKSELAAANKIVNGESVYDLIEAQRLYVKHGLKKVEGIKDYDGDDYELEFEGDQLTDECVDEIFNIEQKNKFMSAAWQLLNGVPDKLIDPITQKEMKGVSLKVLGKKKSG